MKPDKILYGENEFYEKINNKIYNIYKVDSISKEIFMIKIFKIFIKNQKKNTNEKHYLGLDFEFNKISKSYRDIALMQINLENDGNIGYIFIFNPSKLKSNNIKILIKLLITKHIIKILHGSESLDIPYLFNQLLVTEENINKFNNNFYDTKFICEFINIKNKSKISCSIYELLLNNKIISNKQIDKLNDMETLMGPIYLINIDIYNLNDNVFNYALYDVLYLPELIKKLFSLENNIVFKLISELLGFINIYKRNIDDKFIKLEAIINDMNNYYFYVDKIKYKLNEVWLDYYNMITNNYYIDLCTNINYFKHFFKIITKYIVYSNICKIIKIKKNKTDYININNFDSYWDLFNKYPTLYNLFDEINYILIYDFKVNWIYKIYLKK